MTNWKSALAILAGAAVAATGAYAQSDAGMPDTTGTGAGAVTAAAGADAGTAKTSKKKSKKAKKSKKGTGADAGSTGK